MTSTPMSFSAWTTISCGRSTRCWRGNCPSSVGLSRAAQRLLYPSTSCGARQGRIAELYALRDEGWSIRDPLGLSSDLRTAQLDARKEGRTPHVGAASRSRARPGLLSLRPLWACASCVRPPSGASRIKALAAFTPRRAMSPVRPMPTVLWVRRTSTAGFEGGCDRFKLGQRSGQILDDLARDDLRGRKIVHVFQRVVLEPGDVKVGLVARR